MKPIILFLALLVFSCSSDNDASSDLTENFVGTWKSTVMTVDGYRTQATWEISKTAANVVGIKIVRTVWPYLNKDDDMYSVDGSLSNIRISNKNTMIIEYNLAAPNAEFCGIKGTGKLAGDKLTVVSGTVCKDEDPDDTTQEFTRQ